MGPTASGKTALACELVKRFPFEIISVDSALIYQGMDIGTAKPDASILASAPHHLIDICRPDESYSAAAFCKDTHTLCDTILAKGKYPLLVGGTMMYFRALIDGLSVLPEADLCLREALTSQAVQHGWPYMHDLLKTVDPEAALRIHQNDTQRLTRALEVFQLTGVPLSTHLKNDKQSFPYSVLNLILFPHQRAWLHERIALRFDEMLALGFLNEVENLLKIYALNAATPAMRTVGYRQALDYFDGLVDHSTFRERGIAATRQLAKRQLTWLRSWTHPVMVDPAQVDVLDVTVRHVFQFLNTK